MTRHKSKVLEDLVAYARGLGMECGWFHYHKPTRHIYLAESRKSNFITKSLHSTAIMACANVAFC